MSANNTQIIIIRQTSCPYNLYKVISGEKKYIIGGMPEQYKDSYIDEAKDASAIVLLTSKPEFCGGVEEVVEQNPNIEVYATAAGLRNIKEIINLDINERLIKDGMEVDGLKFVITPNVSWVDTVVAVCNDTLFSGELFSCDEIYYKDTLAINSRFVASAIDKIKTLDVTHICPAIGEMKDISVVLEYEKYLKSEAHKKPLISIVYNSQYGFTKSLAEFAKYCISDEYDIYYTDAVSADIDTINESDMLIVGTNTINHNAPQCIWDIITRLDLVNKRQMPYFVFGSFGWAGDGIKLVDKTLQNMGMKQVSKPVEVLFKPKETDFKQLAKAVSKLLDA